MKHMTIFVSVCIIYMYVCAIIDDTTATTAVHTRGRLPCFTPPATVDTVRICPHRCTVHLLPSAKKNVLSLLIYRGPLALHVGRSHILK